MNGQALLALKLAEVLEVPVEQLFKVGQCILLKGEKQHEYTER
ncbi:hypothetical protein [Paenibacillus pini]|nr:hypothetical protein [Paenibacillus pini]